MAVVEYKFVYKDGGVSGAPLQTFRFVDTYAEIGTGLRNGDLVYINEAGTNNRLFIWINTWYKIPLTIDLPVVPAPTPPFNGGTIGNQLIVASGTVPQIKVHNGTAVTASLNNAGDNSWVGHNMIYGWAKEKPSLPAQMLYFSSNGYFYFYGIPAASSGLVQIAVIDNVGNFSCAAINCSAITNNGALSCTSISASSSISCTSISASSSIRATNRFYESARGTHMGGILDVPQTSGDFWAPAGTVTLNSYYTYSYSLIGEVMPINIHIGLTFSTGVSEMYVKLPGSANSQRESFGNIAWNIGAGRVPGYVHIPAWANYMILKRTDGGILNAGGAEFFASVNAFIYNI